MDQGCVASVFHVGKTASLNRIGKADQQRPAIILQALVEPVAPDPFGDEPGVIAGQQIHLLAPPHVRRHAGRHQIADVEGARRLNQDLPVQHGQARIGWIAGKHQIVGPEVPVTQRPLALAIAIHQPLQVGAEPFAHPHHLRTETVLHPGRDDLPGGGVHLADAVPGRLAVRRDHSFQRRQPGVAPPARMQRGDLVDGPSNLGLCKAHDLIAGDHRRHVLHQQHEQLGVRVERRAEAARGGDRHRRGDIAVEGDLFLVEAVVVGQAPGLRGPGRHLGHQRGGTRSSIGRIPDRQPVDLGHDAHALADPLALNLGDGSKRAAGRGRKHV